MLTTNLLQNAAHALDPARRMSTMTDMLREAFRHWNEAKAACLGAALSYYSVFSLAPLVIMVMGVAALIYGDQAARGGIAHEIENIVGVAAARAIEDLLIASRDTGSCTLATIVGIGVLLFGASGVFIQLQDALNTIWAAAPQTGVVVGLMQHRVMSFVAMLGTGGLLLLSLVVSTILSALNQFLNPGAVPGGVLFWQFLTNAATFAMIALAFALLYKVLPDVDLSWRDVWGGATLASLLFTIGKYLLALYLGQSSTMSTFGAAGSLVVLMIWVYYSAQVFLFGAEFTRVHRLRERGPPSQVH